MIVLADTLLPRLSANGVLMVGDPEIGSRRPGRRRDSDWPNAILRKIDHIVDVANERRLLVVFEGDFFEVSKEPSEALKTRVTRILKRLWTPPLSNVGNHDMENTRLGDGDSLAFLAVSDTLHAVAESGPVMEVEISGKVVGIGMTPYGQEIPRDVTGTFPDADRVLWVTHHDIALGDSYPGAVKPFEIVGCHEAANAYRKPEKVGCTLWYNFGTINRATYDEVGHVPRAWIVGTGKRPEVVELPHEHDVIELTGKLVEAAGVQAVAKSVTQVMDSVFVSMLKAETTGEMEQSGDGSVIAEEMEAMFAERDVADDVRAILRSLHLEAVERNAA
jgi:hypothetical protein